MEVQVGCVQSNDDVVRIFELETWNEAMEVTCYMCPCQYFTSLPWGRVCCKMVEVMVTCLV